ncbi:MarR family winged helix-turn-helix transcriptional regulator [Paenibacillus sp. strain BS8-2]
MDNRVVLEHFVDHMQRIQRYLRSEGFHRNKVELTRVQWMLLRHLRCKSGRTIGQLAEHLDVRASTMSQMIDRLEKMHYVARESSPEDARVKIVKLTPEGAELIANMDAAWLESLEEPFANFDEDEKRMLLSLMAKLSSHLPRKGD